METNLLRDDTKITSNRGEELTRIAYVNWRCIPHRKRLFYMYENAHRNLIVFMLRIY